MPERMPMFAGMNGSAETAPTSWTPATPRSRSVAAVKNARFCSGVSCRS